MPDSCRHAHWHTGRCYCAGDLWGHVSWVCTSSAPVLLHTGSWNLSLWSWVLRTVQCQPPRRVGPLRAGSCLLALNCFCKGIAMLLGVALRTGGFSMTLTQESPILSLVLLSVWRFGVCVCIGVCLFSEPFMCMSCFGSKLFCGLCGGVWSQRALRAQ